MAPDFRCRRAFNPCNISTREINGRGDNSYETDMVRPFRISHRGGRGQDPDRSVSVRQPVPGQGVDRLPCRRGFDTGRRTMKAIVVKDQAAGTAGMTLVERPEPPAAINDVVVQIHASGFVPTEMAWPSTWTDRRDR